MYAIRSYYVLQTKKRTERERQAEVDKVTGVFTGAYAINPLSGEEVSYNFV